MSEIRFVSVPKKVRKELEASKLTGRSKKMTAVEADDLIMKAAQSLEPDEKYQVGLKVTENSRSWDLKTELSNQQANDGLYALISPLLSDDANNEKLLNPLLDSISGELAKAHAERQKEEEEDNDDPSNWIDNESTYEPNSDNNEGEINKDDNEASALAGVSQAKTENKKEDNEKPPVTKDSSNLESHEEDNKKKDSENRPVIKDSSNIEPHGEFFDDSGSIDGIDQDGDSEDNNFEDEDDNALKISTTKKSEEQSKTTPVQSFKKRKIHQKTELIKASDALNLDDIYNQIPAEFSDKTFDINKILKNLGYIDDPKDEYQRRLNLALEHKADELGLSQIMSDYNKDVQNIKQNVAKHLTDYYRTINEKTPALVAQEKNQATLDKLKNDAKENKKDYFDVAQSKKSNNLKTLEKELDAEVEAFTRKLVEENRSKQSKFSNDLDYEVNKHNQLVDKELFEDTKRSKQSAIEAEINQRNSKLNSERLDAANKFTKFINQSFDKFNSKFSSGSSELREFAVKENAKVDEQKARDKKAVQREKAEKARLLEHQRSNDLKAKEIDLKAKNQDEFPTALAAAFVDALKESQKSEQTKSEQQVQQPMNNGYTSIAYPYPTISNNNSDSAEIIKLREELNHLKQERATDKVKAESEKKLELVNQELEKEKEANQKSKASKRRNNKYSIVGAVLLLVLGAGGGYYYSTYANAISTNSSQSKVQPKETETNSNKVAEQSVKTPEAKKNDENSQKKNSEETDNNLKNYQASTTWQQKVDSLNAMLGQHDIRALKEVNDSDPTGLSRLYQAICLKDEANERKIFLYMSPTERKDMSSSARSAVALAFYNVHDWGNGWYARYGF